MDKFTWIISEKTDGNMKIGYEEVSGNRLKFFKQNGIDPDKVVAGQLVSSHHIEVVDESHGGIQLTGTDGLITMDPDIWLAITVADCLPIVIYSGGAIALLHAGWRGLSSGIIHKAARMLKSQVPENTKFCAYIGPAIDTDHYEIQDDVANIFEGYPGAISISSDKKYLDLRLVAREQLRKAGIEETEISGECTYCLSEKYFSARRDKTDPIQAMIVMAKLNTN